MTPNKTIITNIIRALKCTYPVQRIPIVISGNTVAFMRPILSSTSISSKSDIRLMSEWRNLHKESFFTWVTVTEKSTAQWLKQYDSNDHDIMFMIESLNHQAFAHIALYNFNEVEKSCELGRVLKSTDTENSGIMTHAIKALIKWATIILDIKKIYLEVFRDNKKAIKLYTRCGFVEVSSTPLQKIIEEDKIRWKKTNPNNIDNLKIESYALKMVYPISKQQKP